MEEVEIRRVVNRSGIFFVKRTCFAKVTSERNVRIGYDGIVVSGTSGQGGGVVASIDVNGHIRGASVEASTVNATQRFQVGGRNAYAIIGGGYEKVDGCHVLINFSALNSCLSDDE